MGKITLKNISTATVNVISDSFHREFAPGREVPITQEIYDDLMFDPGFNNLLLGHYIVVNGIAEEEAVTTANQPAYDFNTINKMFDTKDYASFAKFLPSATVAEKESVIEIAVKKGITDNGFTSLIKKYCDVDIVSAINQQHLVDEA